MIENIMSPERAWDFWCEYADELEERWVEIARSIDKRYAVQITNTDAYLVIRVLEIVGPGEELSFINTMGRYCEYCDDKADFFRQYNKILDDFVYVEHVDEVKPAYRHKDTDFYSPFGWF